MFRVAGGTTRTLFQCNIFDDTIVQPRVAEDHINTGGSIGVSTAIPIEISYNRFRGHPSGQTDSSGGNNESGSGIQTADASTGGISGNIWMHHNIVTNINGSGVGFVGGQGITMEDNRVDNRGANQATNTGWHFMMKNLYGVECTGHTVRRNRGIAKLWAWNHDGTLVGDRRQ
jgi:hypothetical protein